jgi:integrase
MNRVQIIGHGEAEVKIYPIRRKTDRYRFFQIAWYELGERRTKTLVDPAKAKSFAQQVHVSLLNQGRATEVTPQDIQMFRDAEAITASFGVSIPFAIREWADARKLLGPGILGSAKSLADALHGIQDIPTKTAVLKFVASKEKAGLSKRHVGTMRNLLEPFYRKFHDRSLSQITLAEVEAHVTKAKGGARTKNNLIATLKTFFTWAQKHGHLRQDRPTAADTLTKVREPMKTPEIFTVEEMAAILNAAEPEMVPYMAIGAFAGLRSAEIEKLDWSAIDFETGYIRIAWDIAKTRQRRLVPIPENLKAWLLPVRKESGPVVPRNLRERIQAIGKRAEVPWKSNGLRHSFGSYRLAEVQDAAKVSLEMGNSPQMLFKHYRELVTPEQARQWFAIMPLA